MNEQNNNLFAGNISSLLNANGLGNLLESLTNDHNVTTEQVDGLCASIMPLLKNTINNGISDGSVFSMLLEAGQKIDFTALSSNAGNPETMNEIGKKLLGLVSGGDHNISSTINTLSTNSGISSDILSKIMPTISTALFALFMKQGGGLSSLISSFTDSSDSEKNNAIGGGNLFAAASSLLDQDKDGSVVDDIGSMLKKFL